jgi:predicted TIM-barrel fold metal-dependent hydrolase
VDDEGAIDVHAHVVTSAYRRALHAAGQDHPDGVPTGVPQWSVKWARAAMADAGIGHAVLSVSSPGVLLGSSPPDGPAAVRLAQVVNDDVAAIVAGDREHFSFFASLPLPEVDAGRIEARRALDELGAAGVVLLTNHGGTYPGDPAWLPLWHELDERSALVFLHPTSPPCWSAVSPRRSRAMIEFMFETTRAVVDLVLAGVMARFPRVRLIVPHSGAVLPLVADRLARTSAVAAGALGEPAVDVLASLGRLYYDLAGGALPRGLPALLSLVRPDRLLYGSDYPFTPAARVGQLMTGLRGTTLLSPAERDGMLRDNARRLLAGA